MGLVAVEGEIPNVMMKEYRCLWEVTAQVITENVLAVESVMALYRAKGAHLIVLNLTLRKVVKT
jgi:hypothetical protein